MGRLCPPVGGVLQPRFALAAVVAAICALAAAGTAGAVASERLEVGVDPTVSGDGKVVAFFSGRDLDPRDEDGDGIGDNDGAGVWLASLGAGTFARVAAAGGAGVLGGVPAISADASTVALLSRFNFAGEPTLPPGGIYTRSLLSGSTSLVSKEHTTAAEKQPLAISADGSTVAWDVRRSGSYTLYASRSGAGPTVVANRAFDPDLSASGRFLAYTKEIRGRGGYAVFVKDLDSGRVERVSADSAGEPGSGWGPSISASGRHVAFRSLEELVPGATRWAHVFVKDRKTGRTSVASINDRGAVPKGSGGTRGTTPFRSVGTSISDSGRQVAFLTNAPLDRTDRGRRSIDLYVKDRKTGGVRRVALDAGPASDVQFDLSGDGKTLVFDTPASGGSSEVRVVRLDPGQRVCPVVETPEAVPLLSFERRDARRQERASLDRWIAVLERAIARIEQGKGTGELSLAEARAQLRAARQQRRALSSSGAITGFTEDDKERIGADACRLLDSGASTLERFLKDTGRSSDAKLVGRLRDLKAVLDENELADGGSLFENRGKRREILKRNLSLLVEQFGGSKAGELTGEGLDLFEVLVDGKNLEKAKLDKTLRKKVSKLASKLSGRRSAGQLADKIFTLRDVLAGDLDEAKQFEVLKQSTLELGQRLLKGRVRNVPYVRAAMFGFELGTLFAKPLAANLGLLLERSVARECLIAIADFQGLLGDITAIDYSLELPLRPTLDSENTSLIIPKKNQRGGLNAHRGWECTIVHDFEEFLPGDLPLIRADGPTITILGFKWKDGRVLYFDPAFVG